MEGKVCAQCSHYIGFGDWRLCCDLKSGLTYEYTEACEMFEQNGRCLNRSSVVGGFRCSRCGAFAEEGPTPFERCPSCGEAVER